MLKKFIHHGVWHLKSMSSYTWELDIYQISFLFYFLSDNLNKPSKLPLTEVNLSSSKQPIIVQNNLEGSIILDGA